MQPFKAAALSVVFGLSVVSGSRDGEEIGGEAGGGEASGEAAAAAGVGDEESDSGVTGADNLEHPRQRRPCQGSRWHAVSPALHRAGTQGAHSRAEEGRAASPGVAQRLPDEAETRKGAHPRKQGPEGHVASTIGAGPEQQLD